MTTQEARDMFAAHAMGTLSRDGMYSKGTDFVGDCWYLAQMMVAERTNRYPNGEKKEGGDAVPVASSELALPAATRVKSTDLIHEICARCLALSIIGTETIEINIHTEEVWFTGGNEARQIYSTDMDAARKEGDAECDITP